MTSIKSIYNYKIIVDGYTYDYAVRLDEAIQKAEDLSRRFAGVVLYEIATKSQWEF